MIGLVQVGPQGLADRYTYVPLIGPFIALAWGARDAIAALGARRPAVRIASAALAVVRARRGAVPRATRARASGATRRASTGLRSPRRRATPCCSTTWAGSRRSRAGSRMRSAATRRRSRSTPSTPRPTTTSGTSGCERGDPERAIAHYRAALRRAPDDGRDAPEPRARAGLAGRACRGRCAASSTRPGSLRRAHSSVRRDLDAARSALQGGTPRERPLASPLAQSLIVGICWKCPRVPIRFLRSQQGRDVSPTASSPFRTSSGA